MRHYTRLREAYLILLLCAKPGNGWLRQTLAGYMLVIHPEFSNRVIIRHKD